MENSKSILDTKEKVETEIKEVEDIYKSLK